jgi:hypothetical protein
MIQRFEQCKKKLKMKNTKNYIGLKKFKVLTKINNIFLNTCLSLTLTFNCLHEYRIKWMNVKVDVQQ